VGDQLLPPRTTGAVFPLPEEDVLPGGECLCLQGSVEGISPFARVHPDPAEIGGKGMLHRGPDMIREGLSAAPRLLDSLFQFRRGSHPDVRQALDALGGHPLDFFLFLLALDVRGRRGLKLFLLFLALDAFGRLHLEFLFLVLPLDGADHGLRLQLLFLLALGRLPSDWLL